MELDYSNCEHLSFIYESGITICESCGMEIKQRFLENKEWRDSKEDMRNSNIKYQDSMNFFKQIEEMGYSQDILDGVSDTYSLLTSQKIYRGGMKNAILVSCLYHVIKLNFVKEKDVVFDDILKKFNCIDKKTLMKGLKIVNIKFSKDVNINKYVITTGDLIKSYLIKLNDKYCKSCQNKATHSIKNELFSTHCKEHKSENHVHTVEYQYKIITDLYEKLKSKSKIMLRSRSQSIASSIIYYYYTTIKTDSTIFNIKEYISKINLSELTIHKLIKEFSKFNLTFEK